MSRAGSRPGSRPGSGRRSKDEDLVMDCKVAYLAAMEELTQKIDTKEKLNLVLQQSGRNPSKKVVDKYWKQYEEVVTFDDFCEICKKEPATSEEDLMKAFKTMDLNGDGYITHSELSKIMTTRGEKMSKQEVQAMIDEVDENKDGKLDYKEFCKMVLSTAKACKEMTKEKLEKQGKLKATKGPSRPNSARDRSKEGSRPSTVRERDRTPESSPRGGKKKDKSSTPSSEKKTDPPKPSPRSKRIEEKDFPPVANLKARLQEPKRLKDWTHLHSKGCFYLDVDDDTIVTHHYTLDLPEETSVWIAIEPLILNEEETSKSSPTDVGVFVLSGNGKQLISFTEQRDSKGKFGVRCDMKAGKYLLLPFTSGCRLRRRRQEPKVESKLIKKDKDDKYVLTKAFKDVLSDIFDISDLDGNGLLSRSEFSLYNLRTSGEEVTDEEWEVVEENVELKKGELTRQGFMDLNSMEAEENEGDTEELWVTLSSMGYNKGLVMDEACPFKLDVYTEECEEAKLAVKKLESSSEMMEAKICEWVMSKGDAAKLKHAKEVVIHSYATDNRMTVVIENKASSKCVVRLDCGKSKNCSTNRSHLDDEIDVSARKIVVGHHIMPQNEKQDWIFNCVESVLK